MSPKLKIAGYAVLIILSAWFARAFYSNYTIATAPVPEPGANAPVAAPDDGTNGGANNSANTTGATNTTAGTDTNAAANSDTNAVATTDAGITNASSSNDLAAATATNVVSTNKTDKAHAKRKKSHKIVAANQPEIDVSAARGAMMTNLGAFVASLIGLGLLVAYDVTQFAGTQAVDFLFNDAGEGQRDPEYERAEQLWANGKHLEAIELMREFLKKHPREIYAALRIAEIYEKDLKNPLCAALEYEEILKQKLPAERWGWAAIHLCNLYSKLNKSEQALALLRRIADDYPKTGAAKKARARLGLAEPEPEASEEEAAVSDESSVTDRPTVFTMEERPPELEPRMPSAKAPEAPEEPEPPKPGLPPGFRKK